MTSPQLHIEDRKDAPIRVSVIEDDHEFRETAKNLLNRSPGFRCVSAYSNAEEAVKILPRTDPDVVLVDIGLPKASGIECVRQLKARQPKLQFVMWTVFEDSERIFEALRAGAIGYLLKRAGFATMLEKIREAYQGGSPMTPEIARLVVNYVHQATASDPDLETLTPRENEVLELIANGKRNREIAKELGISESTVPTHIQNIYKKLHIHSRAEAAKEFWRSRAHGG